MKKLIALLLVLVMVVAVFAGCKSKESETPLTVAWYSANGAATQFQNPQFDMSLMIASPMIWEGIAQWDGETGTRIWTIAEPVTANADFTEFTVKIRDGIKWHDGEKVTINDYVFSLYCAMLNPTTASSAMKFVEGYEACKNGETATMSGVTVDEKNNSATFKLTQSYWDFVSNLAGVTLLPAKYFKDVAWADIDNAEYFKKPIGCGPYKIVDVKFPDFFTLTRFDGYYGKPAGIKNVHVVNYVNNADAMATALMTGNLDFVNRTAIADASTAEMIADYNKDVKYLAVSGHGQRCWFFNLGQRADGKVKEDLKKKEVRQAFDILLDETKVAELVGATSSATLVRSNSYDYYKEADARVYDVAAAKALLDAAKFDYSQVIDIAYYYNEQLVHDAHALIVQMFAEAGVTVNPILLADNLADRLYKDCNYDLCMLMCTASDIKPGNNYEKMMSNTSYTFMGYHTERGVDGGWDELFNSYMTNPDSAARAEISKQMQAKNFDECYAIPGYLQATYNAWNQAKVYIPDNAFAFGGSNYHWDEWKLVG